MNGQERLFDIMKFGGFATEQKAQRAVDAVMTTVAELLPNSERRAFAKRLPDPWKSAVPRSPLGEAASSVDEFLRRVARREDVLPEFAAEHVQAVAQPLMRAVDADVRRWLMRRIGEEYTGLFEPVERLARPPKPPDRVEPSPPPPDTARPTGRRKLSSAEPGSTRALNKAQNVSAKGHVVHRRSVAREEEPRADSKLSSAGTERPGEGRHLSNGRRSGQTRGMGESEE